MVRDPYRNETSFGKEIVAKVAPLHPKSPRQKRYPSGQGRCPQVPVSTPHDRRGHSSPPFLRRTTLSIRVRSQVKSSVRHLRVFEVHCQV